MFSTKKLTVRDTHCPGNGTKYELMLVDMTHSWLLCWLNKWGPSSGCTMIVSKGSNLLHYSYLQEKLNTRNNPDSAAILAWVHKVTDGNIDVCVPEGFDIQSGLEIRLRLVH